MAKPKRQKTASQQRDAARPHGVVSYGCHSCSFFGQCGGIEPKETLFDCFYLYCCNGEDKNCDEVCPYNQSYEQRLLEIRGLRFDDLGDLTQSPLQLPRYIPLVHHGYSYRTRISAPVVALETYQVFRLTKGRYQAVAEDAEGLRRHFGLSEETKIILRGTAKDRHLERYWKYRRRDGVPQQLAELGIELAIAPNFSHFLDVPRTDNLFNRKRQLICVTELSDQGIPVVPHLSAVAPGDWRFWKSFLCRNTTVTCVAIEFQTGNRSQEQGRKVIGEVAAIQDAANRPLHPLIIGGTQFVRELARRFERFTLIDSCPFMKAVKRRSLVKSKGRPAWMDGFTLRTQGIEDIFLRNLAGHRDWIDRECTQVTKPAPLAPAG